MRLADYLRDNKLSYSEFARRCGTPHARTIERLAKEQSPPGPRMLTKIIAASGGNVTANDFYPIGPDRGSSAVIVEAAPA